MSPGETWGERSGSGPVAGAVRVERGDRAERELATLADQPGDGLARSSAVSCTVGDQPNRPRLNVTGIDTSPATRANNGSGWSSRGRTHSRSRNGSPTR